MPPSTKLIIKFVILCAVLEIGINAYKAYWMKNLVIEATQTQKSINEQFIKDLNQLPKHRGIETKMATAKKIMSKTTIRHRKGKICDSKKCIYQVEIEETTCYSSTSSCQVTNRYESTETEILAQ